MVSGCNQLYTSWNSERNYVYFADIMKYILLMSSMLLAVIGQFFFKKGVGLSSLSPTLSSIVATIISPYVFLGLISYGLSTVIWLFVLQRFPLSIAYPALSLSYVLVVAIGFLALSEPVTVSKIAGIFLVISGVYLLFR